MSLIIKINQTYIHKQTLIGNKAKMHQPLYYLKIPTNFKPEKKKKIFRIITQKIRPSKRNYKKTAPLKFDQFQ